MAQTPGFWLLGDPEDRGGGEEDSTLGEPSPMPCGLCRLGRLRPLADLGLMTCILSELGCQAKLSAVVPTTGLRSGGAKFTGASMAIASQDP